MIRRLTSLAALVLVVASCTGGAVGTASKSAGTGAAAATASSPPAGDLVSIGAGLDGLAGLSATVYATGLTSASAFAIDPEGRLWVGTADYTDSRKDGIYLVPSAGATPIEVISDAHTPLGLLWNSGSLYVAAAGGVVAYSAFNGTEFADERTILTLPAGVGEVNGLVLGPDGRMRLGVSSPCDSCTPTLADSAAVLSFNPDGTDLQVEASDIRAPVGLAYYPGTSDLFVTMNQRDDLGAATPGDWLAVVQKGESWGFPGRYGQGGSVCSGVPAPVATLDKHAAVSGVAIVQGQLGSTVGTSAIVAEWARGSVLRVALTKTGSTFTGIVAPFLTGVQKPVAVLLGPDGSLFVGDWQSGTIYQIAANA